MQRSCDCSAQCYGFGCHIHDYTVQRIYGNSQLERYQPGRHGGNDQLFGFARERYYFSWGDHLIRRSGLTGNDSESYQA